MKAVADHASDGRGRSSLGVGQAAADAELLVIGQLQHKGTESAAMTTGAGLVGDDHGLGVAEALDLEQRRGAAGLVPRSGLTQHQALAAELFNAV